MGKAVDKVRLKFTEELRKAEIEDRVFAELPISPQWIHVSELYGRIASVSYSDNCEDSSWPKAVAVSNSLDHVARRRVKDYWLSFPPASYCDSLPERKKWNWQEEQNICPVLLQVVHDRQNWRNAALISLEWYVQLPSGIVEIKCALGKVPKELLEYSAVKRRVGDELVYDRPQVSLNHNGLTMETAELQQPVFWGAGVEYSSPITLYWVDYREDQKTTAAQIVSRLAQAVTRTNAT